MSWFCIGWKGEFFIGRGRGAVNGGRSAARQESPRLSWGYWVLYRPGGRSASALPEPTYVLVSSDGRWFLWWTRAGCIKNPALVLASSILGISQHSRDDRVGRLRAERQPRQAWEPYPVGFRVVITIFLIKVRNTKTWAQISTQRASSSEGACQIIVFPAAFRSFREGHI
ncbi:hypothetical protein Dret_0607 [Desulfohalobium retbaense DSM 5692]|uniref:Uncharacterized protein n=1 Tax=Desulfohalobium retbaense (strain ATCC 49708 / DSM 5692 / JCM 16813 / HR100) TaxID=485915 RepID=C8WYY8_DESRD|nr:hypothetical protein Dret_0607 [Desulfohalobium retbaense DSM 5692]